MSKGKKVVKPDEAKNVAAIDAVNKKSPLQERIDARAAKFFSWDDGTGEYAGRAKDVTEAPGMDNLLNIYGNADAMAARSRIGDPSNAFGAGANPGFAKQREALGSMERYNTRAYGLNEGLNQIRGQTDAMADQSISNDMNRKQSYAQLLGQNSRDFYGRPQKVPLWKQIMGVAIGGLGAAGGVSGLKAI